ncbi:unnamed protein product [Sphagnum balticum]
MFSLGSGMGDDDDYGMHVPHVVTFDLHPDVLGSAVTTAGHLSVGECIGGAIEQTRNLLNFIDAEIHASGGIVCRGVAL